MENHHAEALPLLHMVPRTKAQYMNQLKGTWEKLGQEEKTNTIDLDVKKSTLLRETLALKPTDSGKMTEKDMAQAIGVHQTHISHLLKYARFRGVAISLNKTDVLLTLTEGRFREYWRQMSDPYETRGNRTREHRDNHELKVFANILEWLEAGKAPLPPNRVQKIPTVEQMFKTKNPLRALRKEVERRYTTELEHLVRRAKDALHADRSTFSPSFMANAMEGVERWHKSLLQLLADFDKHVD